MTNDWTHTFENADERDAYLADYRRLPVAGKAYFAGFRYADNGDKIRVFARQHVACVNRFTFSERWEDAAR